MSASHLSPLFVLPLELRNKIYKGLLCPDPTRIHTLYHDRQGREPSFNLHPQILSVCKQARDEAFPLLYCNNIFEIYIATTVVKQCTGGIYPDSTPDPPPLLREDAPPVNHSAPMHNRGPLLSKTAAYEPYVELGSRGIMYIHCFQQLRQLRLVTSRGAIWGQARGGEFFSTPGKLILEILHDLIGESPGSLPMILDFIVQPNCRTKYGIFQAGKTDAKDGRAMEIAALLQKLQSTRTVHLEEKVFSDELGRLETKQVDIDVVMASWAGRSPGSLEKNAI